VGMRLKIQLLCHEKKIKPNDLCHGQKHLIYFVSLIDLGCSSSR